MKVYIITAIVVLLCSGLSFSQSATSATAFFNPDFKWEILIPDGFEQVEAEIWDQQRAIPDSLISDSLATAIPKTILAFKSNDFNYFESSFRSYDAAARGDYQLHCRSVSRQLYETFAAQFPDAEIDTASSNQLIGPLQFEKFALKMTLPNGITLNSYMYNRLFGKKDFSANLFYVNDERGRILMEAWLNSRFE